MSSSPKPTDPKKTSAASTGTNVSTAIANAYLGNINEVGPDGNTRVEKTGTETTYDPYTKKTYEIPTFTRTTELSDTQQGIADQNNAASLNLATLGNRLSGTLGNQLTDNFTLDNESTENRLFELGSKRLSPMMERRNEDLRTRLANQGIKAGSAAYDREMSLSNQQENDAWNQLMLSGRAQASQEQLTEDNQRINQISALMSGGQVSQPNFMGANMPTIPTTDNASIIANYDNQMAQRAQQKNAFGQQVLGGLFGLSAGIIRSDERVKGKMTRVGKLKGETLYEYRYKGQHDDGRKHIGVSAQKVEKRRPDAVVDLPDGTKAVDYGALFDGSRRKVA